MSERVLKFRTPIRCSNGHFVFQVVQLDMGRVTITETITKPECNCDLWGADLLGQSQQFTGLLDCRGKEVYEGDILKGTSYLYGYDLKDGKQFDYFGVVKYQSQCDVGLCFVLEDGDGAWHLNQTVHRNAIDHCTGEIIGNIYENPGLLAP